MDGSEGRITWLRNFLEAGLGQREETRMIRHCLAPGDREDEESAGGEGDSDGGRR